MKFKAIKGYQGSGTEVKNTTYVEAARWGKHRGWRYLLGLVVILFAWLIVGTVASVLVAFALSGQPDHTALSPVGRFLLQLRPRNVCALRPDLTSSHGDPDHHRGAFLSRIHRAGREPYLGQPYLSGDRVSRNIHPAASPQPGGEHRRLAHGLRHLLPRSRSAVDCSLVD